MFKSILCINVCIAIETMLNFDGDASSVNRPKRLLPLVVLLVFLLKVPSRSPPIGWVEVPFSFSLAVVRLFSPLWELKCMKQVMIHSHVLIKSQSKKTDCGTRTLLYSNLDRLFFLAPINICRTCLLVATVNKIENWYSITIMLTGYWYLLGMLILGEN